MTLNASQFLENCSSIVLVNIETAGLLDEKEFWNENWGDGFLEKGFRFSIKAWFFLPKV